MDIKTAIANLKHVTNGNDILCDLTIRLETNQAQPTSQHLSGCCQALARENANALSNNDIDQ